jgi:hypothetical protein
MDLAIFKTKNIHCKGDKEAEKMAKKCGEKNAWAIKLLEKA